MAVYKINTSANQLELSNAKPSTSGNVILQTSMGTIEIELYWKHAFKTCQNFRTLACRGYYNNTIFHRIIKVCVYFLSLHCRGFVLIVKNKQIKPTEFCHSRR